MTNPLHETALMEICVNLNHHVRQAVHVLPILIPYKAGIHNISSRGATFSLSYQLSGYWVISDNNFLKLNEIIKNAINLLLL
jgi:hypothetical protein